MISRLQHPCGGGQGGSAAAASLYQTQQSPLERHFSSTLGVTDRWLNVPAQSRFLTRRSHCDTNALSDLSNPETYSKGEMYDATIGACVGGSRPVGRKFIHRTRVVSGRKVSGRS